MFYGYATGVFSSRKIEKATYETLPFRFVAGGLHPDHDTLANFRKTFLNEIKALFVQMLLLAQTAGYFKLGNISMDGSKVHANASKSKAVSYKRLLELEVHLRAEVDQLFVLAEQADRHELPEGMNVADEIALRQERLARLAEAKQVLQARAQERQAAEQAEYEAKQREREAKAKRSGRKPPGRPPTPPSGEPQDKDQYNFTDPESRIMKSSSSAGFEQAYNAQVAVDQDSFLIVACSLSNHPNDKAEAEPTLAALPPALGTPAAAALGQRLLEREEHRGFGRAAHRALHRHGPRAASPELARALCRRTRAACGGCQSAGQDGLQAAHRDRPGHLSLAQMHRRTGDRHHQSRARLPPVLAARPRRRRRRMGLGLFGLQPEAHAHVEPWPNRAQRTVKAAQRSAASLILGC